MSTAEVLKAIQEQKQAVEGEDLEEINLDSIVFTKFTNEINKELEQINTLYSLSLNDCGLITLENFPKLPSLIRLELMDNKIAPGTFAHLGKSCPNLQSLSLGGNPIKEFDDLKQIQNLSQLYQLDLIKCDICNKADYRVKVFEMFPSLQILDNFTQDGEPYDYDEEEGDDDGDDDSEVADEYVDPNEEDDDDEEDAGGAEDSDEDDDEIEAKAHQKKKQKQ